MYSMFTFSAGRRKFICPAEDMATGCTDPKMCIYPDPSDCHGFIQCTDGGQIFHQKCNAGLAWIDEIKNCGAPSRSTCGDFD